MVERDESQMPPTQMRGGRARHPTADSEKEQSPGEEVGKGHLVAWGRGRGGCEKQRHLLWIWKISFPPGGGKKGAGAGLAKTWSLGSPPEHPGIPPAAARAWGGGPGGRRADPARGTKVPFQVYKHGSGGSGLCLRVT